MKKQLLIACTSLCILVIFTSCEWLFGNKHSTKNPLVGKWEFQNLADSNRSSFNSLNSTGLIDYRDSARFYLSFNTDSTLIINTSIASIADTIRYYTNKDQKQLLIQTDSINFHFDIQVINDTVLYLQQVTDSSCFKLKRVI